MHIIGIALGVFGGLWLFVHWAEWRENRAERRELRQIAREAKRQEQQQERERATAQEASERARRIADRAPGEWDTLGIVVYAIGVFAAFPVGYFLILGRH
jgi:hypothetical protein